MFLNYKKQGGGNPIILLHGLFGSLRNLGVISRAFCHSYQIYQFDLPNHGLSPRANSMDYLFQAAEVKKLIDLLNLQDCIVVGHSMGGKVAMMLALLYPSLVQKLVVLDIAPVAYSSHGHDEIIHALEASLTPALHSRAQVEQRLTPYIAESTIRQFLLSSLFTDTDGSMKWRFNLDAIKTYYADIAGWPLHNAAPFTQPTLFIKGQNSNYIKAEHKAAIAAQFPAATARIIANTGHWPHSEKPDSVNRFIQQFLTD